MIELIERAKNGDVDAYNKLMTSIKIDMEKVANKTLTDKSYVDDVLREYRKSCVNRKSFRLITEILYIIFSMLL